MTTSNGASALYEKALEDEPELDYVLGLYQTHRIYYQLFHNDCRTMDTYYFGEQAVPAPEGHDPLKYAMAKVTIDRATDHIDVNNLSIDVPASGSALARAERLKKFYDGVWDNIPKEVLRTAGRHAFAYGIGFLKPMFDTDKWPDAPMFDDYPDVESYREALKQFMESRNISFPFRLSNVNPQNLLWDDSKIKTKWAIEFYERRVDDVRRRYPEWLSDKNGADFAMWLEYWDEEWFGYIADRHWVFGPFRHGYHYLPFKPVRRGASLDQDGPPHRRYQGLLHGFLPLLDAKARIITAYEAILRQYAWRTLDFDGPPNAVQETMKSYELFGGMNQLLPGVSVKPSPTAVPPQELLQFLNLLDNELEMATFPNTVRGVRPRGVSTGFALSVLAGMGRLVFQDVADGMGRAIEECNQAWAKLVEHKCRGRVTVHARAQVHRFDQTISPDDVKGYYENTVTLKAEAPEERERESLLAFRLWNSGMGIISLYEAQRRAGVTNPLEEQVQMGAEAILRSPELQMAKNAMAQQRLGLLEQLAQAASPTAEGLGNQFLPGQTQLQRPGERNLQQARIASGQGQESVFPQGLQGIDLLGRRLGGPSGNGSRMPSGQEVR